MGIFAKRFALVAFVAIVAIAGSATATRAQNTLPANIQSQLNVALAGADAQALSTVQALVTANPGLAAAIAAQAALQRSALAASFAMVATQAQPGQAAAIAGAVASAVPTAAVSIFTSVAAVAPDQAGAIASAVSVAAPDSAGQIVIALTNVTNPAAGGDQGNNNNPLDGGTGTTERDSSPVS